jgi:hypothetical protein
VIKNCSVEGEVKGTTSSSTNEVYIGGVVRENNGTVENCFVTGNVSTNGVSLGGVVRTNSSTGQVRNCYVRGDVKGNSVVGGVAAYNYGGIVEKCYVSGNVFGTGDRVGGVVGENQASTKDPLQNCYVKGNVEGNNQVGGIAGRNSGGLLNCYVDGNVKGNNQVGGVAGDSAAAYISNCVALNKSVISVVGSNVGRISGTSPTGPTVYFRSNYARNDMPVTKPGNPTGPVTGGAKDNINGENITPAEFNVYNPTSWWTTTGTWTNYNTDSFTVIPWNFSTVWEWDNTRSLPKLRGVGGQ